MICIKQNGDQMANFQKERLVCSIPVINLGFSESNMLAEVDNKAL